MKTESLRTNISKDEKKELERVCRILDVPSAQIIREAVREKVLKIKRTHPKLKTGTVETA